MAQPAAETHHEPSWTFGFQDLGRALYRPEVDDVCLVVDGAGPTTGPAIFNIVDDGGPVSNLRAGELRGWRPPVPGGVR